MKFGFDQSESTILSSVYYTYLICFCVAEYEKVMAQKFHLYAGIFRKHWFDTKFFCTHNFDFTIIIGFFAFKKVIVKITAILVLGN